MCYQAVVILSCSEFSAAENEHLDCFAPKLRHNLTGEIYCQLSSGIILYVSCQNCYVCIINGLSVGRAFNLELP